MFKNIKVGRKITSLITSLILFTIIAVSFISYEFSKQAVENKYIENLNAVADLKAQEISDFFKDLTKKQQYIQDNKNIKHSLMLLSSSESDSLKNIAIAQLQSELEGFNKVLNNNLYILDSNGSILFSSDPSSSTSSMYIDQNGNTINESKNGQFFSNVYPAADSNQYFMDAGIPLKDENDLLSGILLVKVDMNALYKITNDTTGLGNTGEIILSKTYGENKVIFLNPFRHDSKTVLITKEFVNDEGNPLLLSVNNEQGIKYYEDYRAEKTLAAWRPIGTVNWGLTVKIDQKEINGTNLNVLKKYLISGFIILLLSVVAGIIFSKKLVTPLQSLNKVMASLSSGILPDKIKKESNDEIGEMAKTTNDLVQALKRSANFAHDIGEGNIEAEFEPLSEQDTLGNALLTMRDNLQSAETRDDDRNWIISGVAEIGEILREHDDLETLSDEVITFVTNKIKAIQGALYIVENENDDDKTIDLKSTFAYNKKKKLQASFKFAEGLVGQSAIEQSTILRTEIPHEYVTITSGILGDQRPKCILLVPLVTNEKVYGVLELASFTKFGSRNVKFVEEVSDIIARTIFNIKVNKRTRDLLEDSQQMSKELQIQQQELRQNAEEMARTQDDLRNSNQQLEDQIEEVNRTQKRMQLLLENASEVITIYEENENIRYISPSVESIMGYTQAEMVGKNDLANIHEEGLEDYHNMFKHLIGSPFEQVTIQYQYKTKSGDYIWIESTGTNKFSDEAIQGIIVNSRDITVRRLAEAEQRMRSKMQALSENSPDLITRLEEDGSISYINPMIENYAGKKVEDFLHKAIEEVDLDKSITEQWLNVLKNVTEENAKVSMEMDFPSEIGERVMQVNAIPEYDEHEKIESVLLVSHDITERKLIELEIKSKNKKINDSINYAQRIQGAILPNNEIINKVLPDSFIMYKPRDVVSGDFPWFTQIGDDIYIAAVDCTGHGVPGALISLIGYFILNDVIRGRKISDPGEILDLMDAEVTKTLRQDQEDSKSKDGMDIALCKINVKKNEVEYAGAHRPLYYMDAGEMVEIKGNKFAIGGGRYRNQTDFTTTKIKVKKGDSIFFCSDGFPDQFGGPDNRKFGSRRTRELVAELHSESMKQVHTQIDNVWEKWKGDEKQTDDLLMIGIKF